MENTTKKTKEPKPVIVAVWRTLLLALIAASWFATLANSGHNEGFYRDVVREEGPVDITLDYALYVQEDGSPDDDELGCLPAVSFSKPVHRVEIFDHEDEQVAEAICLAPDDCIASVDGWAEVCSVVLAVGGDTSPVDAGLANETMVSCVTDTEMSVERDRLVCTGFFTIQAETLDGSVSTLRFSQRWDISDDEWGCGAL